MGINTWRTSTTRAKSQKQGQVKAHEEKPSQVVTPAYEQVVATQVVVPEEQKPVVLFTEKDFRVAINCMTGDLIFNEVDSECLVISMPRWAYRKACRPREIQIRWWNGEGLNLLPDQLSIFNSFESSSCNPQIDFLLTLLGEWPGAQAIIELTKIQLNEK